MSASSGDDRSSTAFAGWIGKSMVTSDEISLPAVQRIAAIMDLDPGKFENGQDLPAHWYSMFFAPNARRSELGHDGHPRKGEFLPPIPLPRRMFVGRKVEFARPLRIGSQAQKRSEIEAIEEKTGRSGRLSFVTVKNTIEDRHGAFLVERQQIVYREAAEKGVKVPAAVESTAGEPQWSESLIIDPVLAFRYSAVTLNGHRIHYDADYARAEEGYPACVVNGALTVHLVINAALSANPGRKLKTIDAKLSKPLFVGETVSIAGKPLPGPAHAVEGWATAPSGARAATVMIGFQ